MKRKNMIIVEAGKEEIKIQPVNDDCEIIDDSNNYGFKNCQILSSSQTTAPYDFINLWMIMSLSLDELAVVPTLLIKK